MDVLGASLFDLIGPLGLKIAAYGGGLDAAERACLKRHFIEEWGLDPLYIDRALPVIEQNAAAQSLKSLAAGLARFSRDNPDCNATTMRTDLIAFLREIALADGQLDEREEMGIETVDRIWREEGRWSLSRRLAQVAQAPQNAIGWVRRRVRRTPPV